MFQKNVSEKQLNCKGIADAASAMIWDLFSDLCSVEKAREKTGFVKTRQNITEKRERGQRCHGWPDMQSVHASAVQTQFCIFD